MAIYLKSNELGGGGIVAEENSEQGIFLNNGGLKVSANASIPEAYNAELGIEMSDKQFGYFVLTNTWTEPTSGKEAYGGATIGGGVVSFGGKTFPDENGIYLNPRMAINSGNDAVKMEVETEPGFTQGVYVNSELDTTKPGISFVDSTIDSANPSKRYFLKDFVLKSDIPAGVDLTNYKGDWSLSTVDKVYYSRPCTYSFSIKNIPSGEGAGQTEPIMVLDSTYTITDTEPVSTGLVLYGNYNQLYSISGLTLEQFIGAASPNTDHVIMATGPGVVYSAGRESGNVYGSVLTCSKGNASFYSTTNATKALIRLSSDGSSTGIIFQDTTIQSDEFTLKSLVDRITALETQVAELQSQLATKANTTSPTFTGKVSINSSN